MEQNRSIKELLQVMLENQHLFETGLYAWAIVLCRNEKIYLSEKLRLVHYIKKNKPLFTWYKFIGGSDIRRGYWWKKGDIRPRIKWIEKHIKKLNKES